MYFLEHELDEINRPFPIFHHIHQKYLDSLNYGEKKEEEQREEEQNNINKEFKDYNDLIKCYICLNPSKDPVICRFCGNIACGKCFRLWVNEKNKCGCCRKKITNNDLISPPILEKINYFLKESQKNDENEKCSKHKEKFLFYCINCVKKYCGKCLSINSEESKNHTNHKIIDYSEMKNSQYNNLINKLDSSNEIINKIDEKLNIYDKYKLENKIKYQTAVYAINQFINMNKEKLEEKNKSISKTLDNLKNIENEINNNCKYINLNLQKLENLEKDIANFNIEKNCQILKDEMEKVKNEKNEIENIQNSNNNIEFKTINFTIKQKKDEIMKSFKKEIRIKKPIYAEIRLEDDETYFSITIPNKYESKKGKIIYLFPIVYFKNKLYEFSKSTIDDENNSMDPSDENNIKENKINIKEDNLCYKTLIKAYQLDEGENSFDFLVFSFSIY